MTEKLEIYKCKICGNIVQVLHSGAGELVCCGENMELQQIKYDNGEFGEKHSPKKEERDGKIFAHVKTHPMLKEHHIEFIQAFYDDKNLLVTKFFNAEEIPEMEICANSDNIELTEYCNIHNLWGENK